MLFDTQKHLPLLKKILADIGPASIEIKSKKEFIKFTMKGEESDLIISTRPLKKGAKKTNSDEFIQLINIYDKERDKK